MKFLFGFFTVIGLITSGCFRTSQIPSYDSFQNKYGLIYFSYPETGRTIEAVFIPYQDQSAIKINGSSKLFNLNYSSGIKFSTANSGIFSTLTNSNHLTAFLKSDATKKIYVISDVRITYQLIKPMITEKSALNTTLDFDTVVYKKRYLPVSYYFSFVQVDSVAGPKIDK